MVRSSFSWISFCKWFISNNFMAVYLNEKLQELEKAIENYDRKVIRNTKDGSHLRTRQRRMMLGGWSIFEMEEMARNRKRNSTQIRGKEKEIKMNGAHPRWGRENAYWNGKKRRERSRKGWHSIQWCLKSYSYRIHGEDFMVWDCLVRWMHDHSK